jgi:AraC-like DNA-binding protein
MTPETFNTHTLPVRDQYEGWRAWTLPLVDVIPQQAVRNGFLAQSSIWQLGDGLMLTQVSVPASRIVRSARLIRHLPFDHWVLSHLLRGTTSMQTPRGTVEIQARQSYLWSLGQIASIRRSNVERVDLLLSRDTFPDIAPLLDTATGSVLDGPLGQFLGNFLMMLLQRLPHISDDESPLLIGAMGKLVAACVAPSAERVEAAQALANVGRMERVRQTVRAHLQSPLLGPRMLCRQVGMSRSNLYRLLNCEGGVTAYIQRQRLAEARGRLSDTRNTQSIDLMARDLCFTDSSSFSRAFRAMFGASPREIRAASTKPGSLSPPPPSRFAEPRKNFGDLLRKPRRYLPGSAGHPSRAAAALIPADGEHQLRRSHHRAL